MPESRLEYLFNCYIQNNCTIQEERGLMALLAQPENHAAVNTSMLSEMCVCSTLKVYTLLKEMSILKSKILKTIC